MAKEPSSTPGLEAALKDVFASMSFEGQGIDQTLMAKVKAEMQAELSAELSHTSEQLQAAEPSGAAAVAGTAAALPPAPPPAAGSPLVRVHFLRFDGAGPGGATVTPALIAGYSADQTAAAFLDAFLLSQGCPPGGEARLDRGCPSGASPATRVQPLWVRMAEALSAGSSGGPIRGRGPGDGEDAAPEVTTTSEPAHAPLPEVTVHWYPPPPEASGLRGTAGGGNATWVRVVTTTRRSVFAPFHPAHTSVGDLRRVAERECGVPVEWQRLFCGAGALLDGPDAQVASVAGVVAGMNLFLTARVPGAEYGGANADLA